MRRLLLLLFVAYCRLLLGYGVMVQTGRRGLGRSTGFHKQACCCYCCHINSFMVVVVVIVKFGVAVIVLVFVIVVGCLSCVSVDCYALSFCC